MGKLEFQVLKRELSDAVSVYTETYACGTFFETYAKERCIRIAQILNKNQITFSLLDGHFYFQIFINQSDKEKVYLLAKNTNVPFWIRYLS